MSIQYRAACCGCATETYPCLGKQCPLQHTMHLFCDNCKEECNELYRYDEQELCEDCLLEQFEKVRKV